MSDVFNIGCQHWKSYPTPMKPSTRIITHHVVLTLLPLTAQLHTSSAPQVSQLHHCFSSTYSEPLTAVPHEESMSTDHHSSSSESSMTLTHWPVRKSHIRPLPHLDRVNIVWEQHQVVTGHVNVSSMMTVIHTSPAMCLSYYQRHESINDVGERGL